MAHTHTPYKILLWNLGYSTDLKGSLLGYFFGAYRFFHTPRRVMEHVRESVREVVEREQPNLCCFAELRKGSAPFSHVHVHAYEHMDNKYGKRSILRHIPMFRSCCNGFWSRDRVPFHKKFFRNGTKKLIYEMALPGGLRVLFVHLSLREKVRRQQYQELRRMIDHNPRTILCGDFNTLHGQRERDELMQACRLRLVNADGAATFPTVHPRKTLDLFLCPEDVEAEATVIPDARASDHLPVLLTLRMA